ncbi:MAG: 8-oxo-dGTP diphosphatase [Clostridiales bacterium]|nr:8-oxo-dGTP diphosphatase [Clostridiales bacterium]
MRLTTLCYIERDGAYLMLHRTKKNDDQSHDKWLGVGGKFEDGESPEECMLREVREETGLTLTSYAFRGIVTFVSDCWETEYMHLFTAKLHDADSECLMAAKIPVITKLREGESAVCRAASTSDSCGPETVECAEGVLEWIPKEEILKLNLWEGDRLFLERLNGSRDFFSLKLEYEGERLAAWKFF